jgi:hypothetical protein
MQELNALMQKVDNMTQEQLEQLQQQMLAQAHAKDPAIVLQILGVALLMMDDKTVNYIVDNYADKYADDVKQAMYAAKEDLQYLLTLDAAHAAVKH